MRISDWSSDVCSSDLARQARQHVDRLFQRRAEPANRVEIAQPRRIEDVCAGPLESLQTTDRLVEVGTAPKEILAAGGQHEIPRQPPGGLRCRCDALDRKCEVVNRVVAAVRVILARAARQTGFGSSAYRLRCALRRITEAFLPVALDGDRQRGGEEKS